MHLVDEVTGSRGMPSPHQPNDEIVRVLERARLDVVPRSAKSQESAEDRGCNVNAASLRCDRCVSFERARKSFLQSLGVTEVAATRCEDRTGGR
jgi:hypothetical protein